MRPRRLADRHRAKPLATAVGLVAVVLGVALSSLTARLWVQFVDDVHQDEFDYLARSFSITKAPPHGIKTTGIQSLRDTDVAALEEHISAEDVEHVIPIAQGRAVLRRGGAGFSGGVVGGSSAYLSYMHTPLLTGSMFTDTQVDSGARVILLGPAVVKALYPDDPGAALGSEVRVGRLTFKVIGLTGKDATGGNAAVSIAPVTTVRTDLLGGINTVGTIGIVARSPSAVPAASAQATRILEGAHGARKSGLQNDFTITTFESAQPALARPLILGAFWFTVGVVVLCFLLGTLATASVHATRSRRPRPVAGRRRAVARLVAGGVRDTLIETVLGLALGLLGGWYATVLLAEAAPQLGAPSLISPVAIGSGLVFGLAVGMCAALLIRVRGMRAAHRDAAAVSGGNEAPATGANTT